MIITLNTWSDGSSSYAKVTIPRKNKERARVMSETLQSGETSYIEINGSSVTVGSDVDISNNDNVTLYYRVTASSWTPRKCFFWLY